MAGPLTLLRRLLDTRWKYDFALDCCHRSNGTLRAGPPAPRPTTWRNA
jgi:hypothetical protein